MEGVLRSWAVPKGPSLDPAEKRLAVHVEDHPLEYGDFEGTIPKGQYGGGTVLLWDRGTWHPEGDPVQAYRKGKLKFRLDGEKLQGGWNLVRTRGRDGDEDKENWLLFKENDEEARPGSGDAIVQERPESVDSGRSLEEIAANPDRVWQSNRAQETDGFKEKIRKAALTAKKTAKKASPKTPEPETGAVFDLASLPGARKAKMPERIEPQLATLVSDPPRGAEWVHELKFDGYRVLCALSDGKVRVVTRNGKDWTDRFGAMAEAIAALPARAGDPGRRGGRRAAGRHDQLPGPPERPRRRPAPGPRLLRLRPPLPGRLRPARRAAPLAQGGPGRAARRPSPSGGRGTIRYSDHVAGAGRGRSTARPAASPWRGSSPSAATSPTTPAAARTGSRSSA